MQVLNILKLGVDAKWTFLTNLNLTT